MSVPGSVSQEQECELLCSSVLSFGPFLIVQLQLTTILRFEYLWRCSRGSAGTSYSKVPKQHGRCKGHIFQIMKAPAQARALLPHQNSDCWESLWWHQSPGCSHTWHMLASVTSCWKGKKEILFFLFTYTDFSKTWLFFKDYSNHHFRDKTCSTLQHLFFQLVNIGHWRLKHFIDSSWHIHCLTAVERSKAPATKLKWDYTGINRGWGRVMEGIAERRTFSVWGRDLNNWSVEVGYYSLM